MPTTAPLVNTRLHGLLDDLNAVFEQVLQQERRSPMVHEVGSIASIARGIATVRGLEGVRSEELVILSGTAQGMVFDLHPDEIGVMLFENGSLLAAGSEVKRTGRVMDVPVGDALLGRIIDATGSPLDLLGPLRTTLRRPIEREAPAIMSRAPVSVPLQTGIKVVDALIPIGRGQRELIIGDRQTGKTAIALDTIINQRDKGVLCVYCAIGQRASSIARLIDDLRRHNALEYTTLIVAAGEDPPGLQFVAPYAATTIAEFFMGEGRDVLIVYDDLTRHARAYRELSLLLRRPPGREAFPGDIFYIHSRLLERATRLRDIYGGGSLTALPIIETEAQNIAAYIPTNLISITDGQIVLSPQLFQKGVLPAVDVGRSVSRVGGKAQSPFYRTVAGDLRLSYTQFEELERFARFSTRLDEQTRKVLERGRKVRELLKQQQFQPMPASLQIAVLLAVTDGIFDNLPEDEIGAAEKTICTAVTEQAADICRKIEDGEKLYDEDRYALSITARRALSAAER